jgi:hypothetical protein
MSSKFIIDESKPHLGGNTIKQDKNTWSPSSWKYVIEKFNVKSVIDLGSGEGYTAKWFKDMRLDVTAVEGLEINVKNAVIPTILHDLTTGPFKKSADLVICIEVVEHIEETYLENLLESMCQGKYLFMTHAIPGQPGYHHVNCQESQYWIDHLSNKNFLLLEEESKIIQSLADRDKAKHIARNGMLFAKSN